MKDIGIVAKMKFKWKDKTLGYLYNRNLIMPRKRSKHFFRMFKGWGISEDALDILIVTGIREMRIVEEEKNETFIIKPEEWRRNGIPHEFGDEKQLICPEHLFSIYPLRKE